MASLKDSLMQGAARAKETAQRTTQRATQQSYQTPKAQTTQSVEISQLRDAYAALPEESRRKYAAITQRVLGADIESYRSDYDNLRQSYLRDQQRGYRTRDDANSFLGSTNSAADALNSRRDRYAQLMDIFGDDMDADFRSGVADLINSTSRDIDTMRQYAANNADFFSQFQNEGEYNTYQDMQAHYNSAKNAGMNTMQWYDDAKRKQEEADERYKQAQRAYANPYSGRNEETKAALEAAARDKYAAMMDLQYADAMRFNDWNEAPGSTQAGQALFALNSAMHEQKVEAQREKDYQDYLRAGGGGAGDMWQEDLASQYKNDWSYKQPMDGWSQEQIDKYYSIYASDTKLADEYAMKINNQNAAKVYAAKVKPVQEWMERVPDDKWRNFLTGAAGIGAGVATAPEQMFDYLDMMAQLAGRGVVMQKAEPLFSDYAEAMVGQRVSDLNEQEGTIQSGVFEGKGWGDVYQLGESVLQSITLGHVAGPLGTSMVFFGTAAKQGLKDALDRGVDPKNAMAYSIATGMNEAAFEYFSLDKLLNMGDPSTLAQFFTGLLTQGFVEGSEEFNTSLANSMAQAIFLKDKSDIEINIQKYIGQGFSYDRAKKMAIQDWGKELANDFAGGFISGGVSGGMEQVGGMAISSVTPYTQSAARQYQQLGMSAEEAQAAALADRQQLFETAADLAGQDAEAYGRKLQQRTEQNKDISLLQAQRLDQLNRNGMAASDIANTTKAVQDRLEQLGSKDAKLASAITAVALENEAKRIGAQKAKATLAQRRMVAASPIAQQVLSEMDVENLRGEQQAEAFNIFAALSGASDEELQHNLEPYQRSNEWVKKLQGNKALAADVYGTKATVTAEEKASVKVNGETAKIVGAEDGKAIVEQNGERKTVALDDIEGIGKGYRQLVTAAANGTSGEAMLRLYNPGQNVDAYAKAWNLAENVYGAQTNISYEEARGKGLLRELTDNQLKFALELGRERYDTKQTQAQERSEQFKAAREKAKKQGTVQRKKGTVSYDGGEINGIKYKGADRSQFTRQQKKVAAMVETMADAVNLDS